MKYIVAFVATLATLFVAVPASATGPSDVQVRVLDGKCTAKGDTYVRLSLSETSPGMTWVAVNTQRLGTFSDRNFSGWVADRQFYRIRVRQGERALVSVVVDNRVIFNRTFRAAACS